MQYSSPSFGINSANTSQKLVHPFQKMNLASHNLRQNHFINFQHANVNEQMNSQFHVFPKNQFINSTQNQQSPLKQFQDRSWFKNNDNESVFFDNSNESHSNNINRNDLNNVNNQNTFNHNMSQQNNVPKIIKYSYISNSNQQHNIKCQCQCVCEAKAKSVSSIQKRQKIKSNEAVNKNHFEYHQQNKRHNIFSPNFVYKQVKNLDLDRKLSFKEIEQRQRINQQVRQYDKKQEISYRNNVKNQVQVQKFILPQRLIQKNMIDSSSQITYQRTHSPGIIKPTLIRFTNTSTEKVIYASQNSIASNAIIKNHHQNEIQKKVQPQVSKIIQTFQQRLTVNDKRQSIQSVNKQRSQVKVQPQLQPQISPQIQNQINPSIENQKQRQQNNTYFSPQQLQARVVSSQIKQANISQESILKSYKEIIAKYRIFGKHLQNSSFDINLLKQQGRQIYIKLVDHGEALKLLSQNLNHRKTSQIRTDKNEQLQEQSIRNQLNQQRNLQSISNEGIEKNTHNEKIQPQIIRSPPQLKPFRNIDLQISDQHCFFQNNQSKTIQEAKQTFKVVLQENNLSKFSSRAQIQDLSYKYQQQINRINQYNLQLESFNKKYEIDITELKKELKQVIKNKFDHQQSQKKQKMNHQIKYQQFEQNIKQKDDQIAYKTNQINLLIKNITELRLKLQQKQQQKALKINAADQNLIQQQSNGVDCKLINEIIQMKKYFQQKATFYQNNLKQAQSELKQIQKKLNQKIIQCNKLKFESQSSAMNTNNYHEAVTNLNKECLKLKEQEKQLRFNEQNQKRLSVQERQKMLQKETILREHIIQIQDLLKKKNAQTNQLKQQLQRYEQSFKQAQYKNEQLLSEIKQLQTKIQQRESKIKQLQKIQQQESNNERVRAQRQNCQKEKIEELKSQYEIINEQLVSSLRQNSELRKIKNQFNQKITKLIEQKNFYYNQCNQYSEKLRKYEQNYNNKAKYYGILEQKFKKTQSYKSKLQQKLFQQKKQLEDYQNAFNEFKSLKNRNEQINEMNKELQKKIQEMMIKKGEVDKQNRNNTLKINMRDIEIQQLKNNKQSLEREINKKKKHIQYMSKKCQEIQKLTRFDYNFKLMKNQPMQTLDCGRIFQNKLIYQLKDKIEENEKNNNKYDDKDIKKRLNEFKTKLKGIVKKQNASNKSSVLKPSHQEQNYASHDKQQHQQNLQSAQKNQNHEINRLKVQILQMQNEKYVPSMYSNAQSIFNEQLKYYKQRAQQLQELLDDNIRTNKELKETIDRMRNKNYSKPSLSAFDKKQITVTEQNKLELKNNFVEKQQQKIIEQLNKTNKQMEKNKIQIEQHYKHIIKQMENAIINSQQQNNKITTQLKSVKKQLLQKQNQKLNTMQSQNQSLFKDKISNNQLRQKITLFEKQIDNLTQENDKLKFEVTRARVKNQTDTQNHKTIILELKRQNQIQKQLLRNQQSKVNQLSHQLKKAINQVQKNQKINYKQNNSFNLIKNIDQNLFTLRQMLKNTIDGNEYTEIKRNVLQIIDTQKQYISYFFME